jgi:hypothetical protein
MVLRGGKVALEDPKLALLNLEPVDELHCPNPERGSRGGVEQVPVTEALEDAEGPFEFCDSIPGGGLRRWVPLGERDVLMLHHRATQGETQPQIEVLTATKAFVEEARGEDGLASDDNGRKGDLTALLYEAEQGSGT